NTAREAYRPTVSALATMESKTTTPSIQESQEYPAKGFALDLTVKWDIAFGKLALLCGSWKGAPSQRPFFRADPSGLCHSTNEDFSRTPRQHLKFFSFNLLRRHAEQPIHLHRDAGLQCGVDAGADLS
ncbi:MAG: hypothetical protein AAB214_17820, partial [Fibrobacterota bacterium]